MQKEVEIKRYLGIDYGQRKVGLAISDSETRLAFAHSILERGKNFFPRLLEIIRRENVHIVVIGIPSYINDGEVEYAGEVLGNNIKREIPEIEIVYQNEMFSTKIAEHNLRERGVKKIARFDDQEAARIILQSWLEQSRNV